MTRLSRLSVFLWPTELTLMMPALIFAGFTVGFAISRNTAVGLLLSGVMVSSLLCPALVSGYLWMRVWFFGRHSSWYARIASLVTVGVGLALFYECCCRLAWVGVFAPASPAARLTALQAVADYEFASCGMETIPLEAEPLEFATMGEFHPETNTISLVRNYFLYADDPAEALDTVLHECRHAFQHAVCELFDTNGLWESPLVRNGTFFAQEMQWRSSIENYVTEDYWTTSIEEDARSCAGESA